MMLTRRGLAVLGSMIFGASALLAGVAQAHDTSVLPAGTWTPEQVAFAEGLVHRTEAALPKYSDRKTLAAQGFVDFGISTIDGWDHWTNIGRVDDDHVLDPAFPESLVLRSTPEGYRVEAAMFILPSGYTMANIPADIAWLPLWHTHEHELCIDDQFRFTGLPEMDGRCTSGHDAVTPPMMHVWTVDNPCGHRFAGLGVMGLECGMSMSHGHPGSMPSGTWPDDTMPFGTGPAGTGPVNPWTDGTRSVGTTPRTTGLVPPPVALAPTTTDPGSTVPKPSGVTTTNVTGNLPGAVTPTTTTAVSPAVAVRANPTFSG